MRETAIVWRPVGRPVEPVEPSDGPVERVCPGRRILAVLECRSSDEAVLERAIDAAAASGGYLTLVVVVPRLAPLVNAGPFYVPQPLRDELRLQAEAVLRQAVAHIPSEIPLLTAVEKSRASEAIRRRVSVAAHDLVIVRRRRVDVRSFRRRSGASLVPVAS
jgi:nucleotide-binding universal stress UspA family protein